MPAFVRRQFVGGAVPTVTTSSLGVSDTSVTLSATTGWPTGPEPFYVVISAGSSAEEKCLATISGSTLTLTRAQDDTSAQTHASGASIYPVFTADDADEANEVAAKLTTKGDLLVTTGSVLNRLAVGSNDHVLTADSAATNGVKWAAIPAAVSPNTVDAKGDLLVGTADNTVDKLTAGTNEHRLVADSGETAGLKYVADTTNYAVAAKGDLLAGTAADTLAAVTVGTDGQVLTADSGETAGVKWVGPETVGGLVKVAAASFSAVSAVNVNDVFTSAYENYRVTVRLTATSGTTNVVLRLRAGGTDAATNYYFGGLSKTVGSNATTYFTDSNNATAATVMVSQATGLRVLTLDFMGPQLNERTFFHGSYSDFNSAGHYTVGGSHLTAYQADGFSIIPGGAFTLTGSYIVYGYKP